MSSEAKSFSDQSSLNFLSVYLKKNSMLSIFLFCKNNFGLKSLSEWKVLL